MQAVLYTPMGLGLLPEVRRGQGAAAPIIALLRGRNTGLPLIADRGYTAQGKQFDQAVANFRPLLTSRQRYPYLRAAESVLPLAYNCP